MSEVQLPAPVKAVFALDVDEGTPVAGAFEFYVISDTGDTPRGMIYVCPCGCGRLGALPFSPKTEDDIKHGRHMWAWDGNKDAPTLTPSVHHVGHWHGFLQNGYWVQA